VILKCETVSKSSSKILPRDMGHMVYMGYMACISILKNLK
jgi:hypothetical protein